MINLKYIVTGTGRCGTLYMANLLTSLGEPCSHEGIFNIEGCGKALEVISGKISPTSSKISENDNLSIFSKEIVADSSYMAAPFLDRFNAKVIHVVRNPIEVIGSFIGGYFDYFATEEPRRRFEHFPFENFIYNHIPELKKKMPQIDRACLFYIRWNQMIEESNKVCLFHKVEDDDISKIQTFLNSNYNNYYKNKKSNSRPEKFKWSPNQIQSKEIKKELSSMIKKYKYTTIIF